jgi:hypothetical protein
MKHFCIILALVALTSAASETDGVLSTALKFVKDCGDKSMVLCLKERALKIVDTSTGDVELGEGIKLAQTGEPAQGRSLNEIHLSDDEEQRESEVNALLVDRIARFMSSHTLQIKVPESSIKDIQRSFDEARGKGKKGKKMLLPLLLLFKLKAAALLPLAIGFLALISFKALVIGKIALILSAIIGLKKLFDGGKSTQSYEVVAHPHHSYSSSYDDHHGAYKRSVDAQKMAYSAYH